MDERKIIEDAFNSIPDESRIFVTKLSHISDSILKHLEERKWTISDFSKILKKREKKVFNWIYGISNITLREIAEIEAALKVDIIKVVRDNPTAVKEYSKYHTFAPSNDQLEKYLGKGEFERKFIDTVELSDWEVETDTGWSDIKAIGKTIEYNEWNLKTESGLELTCADTHIVFKAIKSLLEHSCSIEMKEIFVKDLKIGDEIFIKKNDNDDFNNPKLDIVKECYKTDKKSNMYDLQLNDENHRFYTNGILSHNSMWLYNIACNSAENGRNVAVITVEMGWRKVIKRLGAMRLKIDVDQYSELSKDTTFIKNKINALKKTNNGLFNTDNPGKIFVKKFNTGSCTITDIDNYLTKLEEVKNVKIDVVVLDYINLMSIDKSSKEISNNLYMKGKHLAEGLRYIADKFDLALITATQVDRAVWGANDIKLNDIPESKAIAETADSVWAIIRNSDMKRHNKYRLKILKLRDGDHKEETIGFDFHPQYLTIENDIME